MGLSVIPKPFPNIILLLIIILIIGFSSLITANYISITEAIKDVKNTHAAFTSSPKAGVDEYIAHKVALKRYESSIILSVVFLVFPTLYICVLLGVMSGPTSCSITFITNCLAKNFYRYP